MGGQGYDRFECFGVAASYGPVPFASRVSRDTDRAAMDREGGPAPHEPGEPPEHLRVLYASPRSARRGQNLLSTSCSGILTALRLKRGKRTS